MDLIDRNRVWKNLKQRLALRRMGCCGATSTSTPIATATITIIEALHLGNSNYENDLYNVISAPSVSQVEGSSVDLAMALAAERNFRLSNIGTQGIGKVKTLVALIEETDGVDLKKVRKRGRRTAVDSAGGGRDYCCVCMERNKGAAFIPCGHTFCRVCSRELWLNRGSCPICNRSITEILHIF